MLGGALFRNFYRDFLKESAERLQIKEIETAYHDFKEIASSWTDISNLFVKIGETREEKYLHEASNVFAELSIREKQVMERLRKVCT